MSSNDTKMAPCLQKPAKGVLLDISGVLYECGTVEAIEGSVDAVRRLREARIPFRFVTNETQRSRNNLLEKLSKMGFEVNEKEVFAPAPAVSKMVKSRKLRPHFLVHPGIMADFEGCETSDPNCVVIGDAAENFTYANMNSAFQLLVSLQNPILISMGKGKYYKEKGRLVLDLGAFTAALEYACDLKALVMGKPSADFFGAALQDMNVSPEDAIMVGDDIVSDVGASQQCGMTGILVRTGKFRATDENHPTIRPDCIVKNLGEAVDLILSSQTPP